MVQYESSYKSLRDYKRVCRRGRRITLCLIRRIQSSKLRRVDCSTFGKVMVGCSALTELLRSSGVGGEMLPWERFDVRGGIGLRMSLHRVFACWWDGHGRGYGKWEVLLVGIATSLGASLLCVGTFLVCEKDS